MAFDVGYERTPVTQALSGPTDVVPPSEEQITRAAQFGLMGLPDASADLDEGGFATMCSEGFYDPVLKIVLGCHATSMTGARRDRPSGWWDMHSLEP